MNNVTQSNLSLLGLALALTSALVLTACQPQKSLQATVVGLDGASCTASREEAGIRIACSRGSELLSSSFIYDGTNGSDGASCTAKPVKGGAYVYCGENEGVFIANGENGVNGTNGVNAIKPGLSCNVHNLSNWNGVTSILTVLSASSPVGSFTLPNLNVGDSQASGGFPGMPSSLQSSVGLDGYALDCNGYLNIETSGMYTFSMLADDGVRLMIDNNVIVNFPGLQAPTTRVSPSVELQRGLRAFNVIYYQGPFTQIALRLSYSGPHTPLQVIPTSRFSN